MTHGERGRSDALALFIGSTWSSAVCGFCDVAGRTLVCVFGRRVCGVGARESVLLAQPSANSSGTSPMSASTLGRLNCGIELSRRGASRVPASHRRSIWPTPPLLCGREVKMFHRVHAGFAPPYPLRADPCLDRFTERLALVAVLRNVES